MAELRAEVGDVYLTPQKEEYWKKWIGLYNENMLSRGTFRNLYVYGYDVPEGYAIEKDGAMYYAFFAPQRSGRQARRGSGMVWRNRTARAWRRGNITSWITSMARIWAT